MNPKREYYPFLEGLRAIAALFVVLHHAWMDTWHVFKGEPGPQGVLGWVVAPLAYGHAAVTVFITISGFCLMLPILRSGPERFDARRFLWRRCVRILPPYYGALLLGTYADSFDQRGVSAVAFVQHVFLIHNWTSNIFKLNAPLWSVAAEFQIYLLFPFLLILYRKSILLVLALSSLLGFGAFAIWPNGDHPTYYPAIFSLGMWAAVLVRRQISFPFGATAAAMFALTTAIYWCWGLHHIACSDLVIGIGAAALLTHCATEPRAVLPRVLTQRLFTWLGTFSYSLYLVHQPLQIIGDRLLVNQLPISQTQAFLARIAIIAPLILGLAYLFFQLVEKRFLRQGKAGNITAKMSEVRELMPELEPSLKG